MVETFANKSETETLRKIVESHIDGWDHKKMFNSCGTMPENNLIGEIEENNIRGEHLVFAFSHLVALRLHRRINVWLCVGLSQGFNSWRCK